VCGSLAVRHRADKERSFDEEIEVQLPAYFPIQEPLTFLPKLSLPQQLSAAPAPFPYTSSSPHSRDPAWFHMSLLKVWVPASAGMTVVRALRAEEERGFDEENEVQLATQFPIQEPLSSLPQTQHSSAAWGQFTFVNNPTKFCAAI
jgi:hypothetical protein